MLFTPELNRQFLRFHTNQQRIYTSIKVRVNIDVQYIYFVPLNDIQLKQEVTTNRGSCCSAFLSPSQLYPTLPVQTVRLQVDYIIS